LPSVILLRMRDGLPEVQTRVLLNQMHKFEEDLERGAIVVIGDNQIRIRRLPIR